MLQKTIKLLYSQVVTYLQETYVYDSDSKIPRTIVYNEYLQHQKTHKTPEVEPEIFGKILRFALPRAAGNRTQVFHDGKRVDCYFLKKSKKIICFLCLF